MIEWRESSEQHVLLRGGRDGIDIFKIVNVPSVSSIELASGEEPLYELRTTVPGMVAQRSFDVPALKQFAEEQFTVWADRMGLKAR